MNKLAKEIIFKKIDEINEEQKKFKEEHTYESDKITEKRELLIEVALEIMRGECDEEARYFVALTGKAVQDAEANV